MAEEDAQGAAGAAGQQPPAPPTVKILAHYVRDLSFENVGAMKGTMGQGNPEVTVVVNLEGNSIGEDRYQVIMKVNATAKHGEETRFVVELDYGAIFSITGAQEDHIHPLVFIECPRLLLPFVRRVVADVTRDGGYSPLMIDTVDFSALYRQRLEQFQAQQAAGGAAQPNGAENAEGSAEV